MRKRAIWEPNPETILQDLLQLADQEGEARPRKTGSLEKIYLMNAKRAAKRLARQQAAWDVRSKEIDAARAAKRAQSLANPARVRWLLRMVPGEWASARDIVVRKADTRNFSHQLVTAGLVERAQNAAWTHNGCNEPRYLFRLTAAGEVRRALHLGADHLQEGKGEALGNHGVDRDGATRHGLSKVN